MLLPFLPTAPFVNIHLQSKDSLQRGRLGLTTGQTEFLSHSVSENVKLDLDQWESAIIIKQKKSRQTSVPSGSTESILITSYCLVQNTVPSAWTVWRPGGQKLAGLWLSKHQCRPPLKCLVAKGSASHQWLSPSLSHPPLMDPEFQEQIPELSLLAESCAFCSLSLS